MSTTVAAFRRASSWATGSAVVAWRVRSIGTSTVAVDIIAPAMLLPILSLRGSRCSIDLDIRGTRDHQQPRSSAGRTHPLQLLFAEDRRRTLTVACSSAIAQRN